jgi:putative spermidine/putrescine transport system substrate-binding protein
MLSRKMWLVSASIAAVFATVATASAQNMDQLVAAAKAEGQLTTIALPHSWCGYGDVIANFKKKYGIQVNELNPNAGSGDEIEAIKANEGNTGPQAPDVIDVGLGFGPSAKADGLLQPYKVSTWKDIPDSAKDADGYWYGDYYGVLGMGINKDIVTSEPKSFSDLANKQYVNSVALAGDPRTGSSTMMTVYAAGVSADGKAAGADALDNGIKYFRGLKDNGILVPVNGTAQNLAQGTTPIYFDWDYNLLAMRDKLAGNPPVDVVVPSDSVVAGVYIQAISAYAPHPNAAKLWMEYLYSDEGQLGWLAGYCHPIRFNALSAAGKLPANLMAKLPPAENYAKAIFPTLDEQAAAKQATASNWAKGMGVE